VPETADQTDHDSRQDGTRSGPQGGLQKAAPAEFFSARADELGDEQCRNRRPDGRQGRDGTATPAAAQSATANSMIAATSATAAVIRVMPAHVNEPGTNRNVHRLE
jgi:hypothetical protein